MTPYRVASQAQYRSGPITKDGPWIPRDGAAFFELYDGSWVLLFGWHNPAPPAWGRDTTNEVLLSHDHGNTWTVLAPHDPSDVSRPFPRHAAPVFRHAFDGLVYLIVLGADGQATGGAQPFLHDVWRVAVGRVSGDTIEPLPVSNLRYSWERMTAAAEWGSRIFQCGTSHNGALMLFGGQTTNDNTPLADLWQSLDCGATWQTLGVSPVPARGIAGMCSFKGRLRLVAGGTYSDVHPRTYYNDAWSYANGIWVQDSPSCEFSPREYCNAISDGERIVFANGSDNTGNLNDCWESHDGTTYHRLPASWPATHAAGFDSTSRGVVMCSGNHLNATVYSLEVDT